MATPLLGDNVGRANAPMATVRFAYDLSHPLSFFLGIFTNFFFIDVLIGDRHVSRKSFTIPFIGVVSITP